MLSMDVVARCRSRVTWVRDGYLPVKPSANDGADLYRVRARNARIRAMRAITKTPLFSQLHTTTTRWV
jgi:hypothetical protein